MRGLLCTTWFDLIIFYCKGSLAVLSTHLARVMLGHKMRLLLCRRLQVRDGVGLHCLRSGDILASAELAERSPRAELDAVQSQGFGLRGEVLVGDGADSGFQLVDALGDLFAGLLRLLARLVDGLVGLLQSLVRLRGGLAGRKTRALRTAGPDELDGRRVAHQRSDTRAGGSAGASRTG